MILGIESSCDETGLALVDEQGPVCDVLSSQVDIHALFGGVVPELASREHARLIGPLFDLLVQKSGKGEGFWAEIEAVAVARGPGLLGCLLVGVGFAKALAMGRNLPLIGVNHLHAHLLAAGMEEEILYPALGVLVSGGHTHLYEMRGPADMRVLGKTIDDAAGEAGDKFAKKAGLPYPGGALLDALASSGRTDPKLFPRPYVHNDNLDFSFSGLKTSGATWLDQHPEVRFPQGESPARERLHNAPQELRDVAASYLTAVAETLAIKARAALERFPAESIVLAGGVAANSQVRAEFAKLAAEVGLPLLIPGLRLCTDNAIMVAWNGLLLHRLGLRHNYDLRALPRGHVIPEDWAPASRR